MKNYKQKLINKLKSYKRFDKQFIDNQIKIIENSNCNQERYKRILEGGLYKTLLELHLKYKETIYKENLAVQLKKRVVEYVTYYKQENTVRFDNGEVYVTTKLDNLDASLFQLCNKAPMIMKEVLKSKSKFNGLKHKGLLKTKI